MSYPAATIDNAAAQRLVTAARAGDHEAFAGLVRAYSARLFNFLSTMGIPASDADDLCQEVFIRVDAHLDRYDPTYAFATWLFTIARRLALNHLARRNRQRPLHDEAMGLAAAEPEDGDERAGSIWQQARELLPERFFQVLWLRFAEDLDPPSIGRVMGITGLHARVLVHRACTRLGKALRALPTAQKSRR